MAAAAESLPIYDSPILIVDDGKMNRMFLEKALRSRGFTRLFEAANGEEALRRLEEIKPELLILDIMMPVMDGFECCARIRQMPLYRDLPILIQTAFDEPELRIKAFAQGATDFVSKPIYPAELYARVMVHLEKRLLLKDLQLYKGRIEQELESARQLQYAILPQPEEIAEVEQRFRFSIASHFQPSSEIGGDFWGIKNLSAHCTAFWMVDFSGHGVPSALNAFRLQAYLKEPSALAAQPGEYLSHLGDKLLRLLLRGQFATMFYGIVDTQADTLSYACAASPHPIVLRHDGSTEIIDGSGLPLGIVQHSYPTQRIDFRDGDTLLLYSDALTETPSADGKYISIEQIMALLNAHRSATPMELKRTLLDAFRAHGDAALADDLTIALCTRR